MKKVHSLILAIIFLAGFLQSCDDLEEVTKPNFNINFPASVKVGEPVTFTVENTPDFLLFYAGDFGREYKHRNRVNADGTVTMSFKNAQKWGLGANATGTLSVWYSRDYDGNGTPEGVTAATWTDISDRFGIDARRPYTFNPLFESGVIDITDLADGNPIYFAFRYFCDNTSVRPSEWWLDDLKIQMVVENAPGPFTVATERKPGFKTVDVQGIDQRWNSNKWYWDSGRGVDGLWRMRGAVKIGGVWVTNDDWLITNPINLTKVDPDKGTPLKTFSEKLEAFEHTYTTPGTYTITLIGNNETIHGKEEVVKEYTITVTE